MALGLAQRTVLMIQIRVMRFNDELGHQFVDLVNRLLPAGTRFHLEPMPRLEYVEVTPGIAFPFGSTHVRELVGEARVETNAAAPGSTAASEVWKRRFRDELVRLAEDGSRTATMELVSGDHQTMVGGFRLRRLDVQDLARMPDMMAASALIHELEEQTHRGSHPWQAPAFGSPHAQAMAVEQRVSGGERLENLELRHPENADVTTVTPSQHWTWWVPFRTGDGGLWANQMEMVGRNVLRARLGRYTDEGAYREAFTAMVASRRVDSERAAASAAP